MKHRGVGRDEGKMGTLKFQRIVVLDSGQQDVITTTACGAGAEEGDFRVEQDAATSRTLGVCRVGM
jgi:hypothetical protein